MYFMQNLPSLGVTESTLAPDEKRSLDKLGYVELHDVISLEQAARMREETDRLFALENTPAAGECGDLHNKSDAFDICVMHPRILAAVAHVLDAPFKLVGINTRMSPPGTGDQAMHLDGDYGPPGVYYTCNSIWPLTDFTEQNGATRVVPGSHCSGAKIDDDMPDLKAPHPREIKLVANVGTVVIFNGHTWHSATVNRSNRPRQSVTSFWCRRELPSSFRPMGTTISAAARVRMGDAVLPFFDPA